jgi:hypothetical protein
MPKFQRDRSGAVIISYSEGELEDHLGYRLLKLEERVKELERQLKEVIEVVLYLKREEGNGKVGGCCREESV